MRLPRPLFLALRTLLYLLLALLLIRGAASFLPKPPPATAARQPEAAASKPPDPDPPDLQALPALFATEYLTWETKDPAERAMRVALYLLPGIDPHLGWRPGTAPSSQTVQSAFTVQTQPDGPDRWLATVAAIVQLEPTLDGSPKTRTLYLSVPLALTKTRALAVSGPPALLPLPLGRTAAASAPEGTAVQDDRAAPLLTSFFTTYFSGGNTSYFLAKEARLVGYPTSFTLKEVGKPEIRKTRDSLTADVPVTAQDLASGSTFTFRYTLRLTDREGRLYILDLLQKGA